MVFESKEKKILEKNKTVYINNGHFYNLNQRNVLINLFYSNPILFKYKNLNIRKNRWQHMFIEVVKQLVTNFNINKDRLLNIYLDWKKTNLFEVYQINSNYMEIPELKLYFMYNQMSHHLHWSLLKVFERLDIDSEHIELLVKLSSKFEPNDVSELFYKKYINQFIKYLSRIKYSVDQNEIKSTVATLLSIDKYYCSKSVSIKSIILFEEINELYKFSTEIRSMITKLNIDQSKKENYLATIELFLRFKREMINR